MREIVLDTETTGTDPAAGDRVIEIGCVELVNHVPTDRTYHVYLNPERAVSAGAQGVHGLSNGFLAAFIGDGRLVIHNAGFDIAFLNAEFARTGHPALGLEDVIDTLALARRRHPGASNSLDALCARYGIDNSRRTKHGALLDAEILAEVYIELIGGKQAGLDLTIAAAAPTAAQAITGRPREVRPRITISKLTEAERGAHEALVQSLGPNALWREYIQERSGQSSAA